MTDAGAGRARANHVLEIALFCTSCLLAAPAAWTACLTPGTTTANLTGDLSDGVCATAPPTTVINVDNLTADITPATGDDGVSFTSRGSNGGNGTTLPIHGTNADDAGNAHSLSMSVLDSSHAITTTGDNANGIFASSIGGTGGEGGGGFGIIIPIFFIPVWFPGFGGAGGDGGIGGTITLFNNAGITTDGAHSCGIYATSQGGNGGDGGWGVGLYGQGGDGGFGGKGGDVSVTNNGRISTIGLESHGLFAESAGGAGGDGGSGWGLFGKGADGGGNADSGTVTVSNSGFIETQGLRADSIHAWSIGGGKNSGGGAGGIFSWGGNGAAAGDGNDVTVNNTGSLVTHQSEASGIYAESVGGGGGNGGDSGSVGPYLSVSVGGSGGPGGNGATTSVSSSIGTITTGEDLLNPGQANPLVRFAYGIFASSKGGGGGEGGFAFSVAASDSFSASFAFGGSGGNGGDGGNVLVDNQSALVTYGDESHGLFAQSLGGGGGNGGFAFAGSLGSSGALSVAFGGTGGLGGDGSTVDVLSQNAILTYGAGSCGIFAQSVGGGGGSGGDSIAISGSGTASGSLSMGGNGGGGGHGGLLVFDGTGYIRQGVSVTSSSDITTFGDAAHGILAQSVGGGGGEGGMAISGSFASTFAAAVALGGGGGTGGDGGRVDVTNSGTIMTSGYKANGIYAQSTGKGGGNGGMSVTGTLTFNPKGSAGIGVSLGGSGGGGGKGDNVSVVNDGDIITSGDESSGIKAQSVGGGGGDGGFSFAGGISGPKSLNAQIAIGGSGGSGNTGGLIDVINNGGILTTGFQSHGIFAESVGGGGGTGGSSVTATLGLYDKTVGVGVSLGGGGGIGGFGQQVSVTNNDTITTMGNGAFGIFAQSVGGGGGTGGAAYSGSAALSNPSAKFNMNINVAIGGSGGTGGNGGAVDLLNTGLIETWGINAHGIYGQSVGGGGGVGGSARTMSLSQCWWECSPKNVSLALNMGGSGGAAGDGGTVKITNTQDIITHGTDSHGIWAQSVGGGGGNGGDGAHGFWGVPTAGISKTTPYLDVSISMGGSQGASGDGGAVTVSSTNHSSITTMDDGSFGIYAQSVGGGGGQGGHGAIGLTGKVGVGGAGGAAGNGGDVSVDVAGDIDTSGGSAHAIFAQSVGGGGGLAGNITRGLGNDLNFGIGVGITKNGGNGGDGGTVTVTSDGTIVTRGQGSMGIFAQSVGGGGGLAGDNGTGFAFSGSAGGDGAGGTITVHHTGNITTLGDNSHGIFAQSGGGAADNVAILDAKGDVIGYLTDRQDTGGDIDITLDGNLSANGADANGIFLQSKGADGNGDITVAVNGLVQGGSGNSAGIRILDGAANTVTIDGGSVTTLGGIDGTAMIATTGDETVNNSGLVTGSVELGSGTNRFNNLGGARLNAGAKLDLGGGDFANAGILSPGAAGRVLTTDLTGNFQQTATGNLALDYDIDASVADRVNVTGTADLAGNVSVSELNLGYAREGTHDLTIVASGALSQTGLQLLTMPSYVLKYDLLYPNAGDLVLRSTVDFTPDPPPGKRMKKNQLALGRHIAAIQAAGGSAAFAPVAAALFRKPDFDSLVGAYDHMLPAHYLDQEIATLYTSLDFQKSLFSCPQRSGDHRFSREGECNWVSFGYNELDYEDNDLTGSFLEKTWSVSGGMQKALNEGWHGGFGFSLERIDLDSNHNATSDGNRVQLGVAFKHGKGPNRLTAAVSSGYGNYDSVRVVDLSVPGVAATSNQNIWFGAAHLRYSHDREYNDWYLRPSIDAGVTYVHSGGFTENGAGGADLQVESSNHTVFTLEPAVEIGGEVARDGMQIRPYARLGLKLFTDTTVDLNATLQGAPAGVAPFRTEGRLDSSVAMVTAGVNILTHKGLDWRIEYAGQFSDRITDHSGLIKLSVPF